MRDGSLETGEIERELDDTRSRLDATIGALQQKLAPATMVDQAVAYFKEGNGVELGRNLGRSVRDNPIPVALIGIGIGWLMMSGSRRQDSSDSNGWGDRPWLDEDRYGAGVDRGRFGRGGMGASRMYQEADTSVHQPMPYEAAAQDDFATKAREAGDRIRREADETEDAFQDRVHAARGSVVGVVREAGEAAASFRDRVEQALGTAADRVRGMAADAGRGASEMAGRGQSMARDAYDYGRSAADDFGHRVGAMAGQARSMGNRTVDYVQDQPLLLGALGVTVGAVIGLMVPSSRQERRFVGAMRENLSETAREAASDYGQRISRVAGSVLDTAQETAKREGLTSSDGPGLAAATRERMADVAGRARHVVEETGAAGVDAVRRELSGDAEPKANGAPEREHRVPPVSTGSTMPPRSN